MLYFIVLYLSSKINIIPNFHSEQDLKEVAFSEIPTCLPNPIKFKLSDLSFFLKILPKWVAAIEIFISHIIDMQLINKKRGM